MELAIIEKEALNLPDMDPALLVDRLLVSLNPVSDDTRSKWIDAVESRLAAFQNGDLQSVDGPETMAALHTRFRL